MKGDIAGLSLEELASDPLLMIRSFLDYGFLPDSILDRPIRSLAIHFGMSIYMRLVTVLEALESESSNVNV